LSIPPISITVAGPLWASAKKTAPLELTVISSCTSLALMCLPTRNRPYPVTPTACSSSLATPAILRAAVRASSALCKTSVVGFHPVPITWLSFITTALVVVEPESIPAVRPVCFSRAKRPRYLTVVTRASILVRSVSAVVLSVKE